VVVHNYHEKNLNQEGFMSSVIRVDPQSIRSYAGAAQGHFDGMHAELQRLIAAVAGVNYHGQNAFQFKSAISDLAVEFANKFTKDMGAIADHIRVVTSNIVGSLGGQPVVITVEGKPISRPAIEKVDYVQVDTAALDGLTPVVKGHFQSLTDYLDQHLRALENTDWQGNAKQQVVATIRDYTHKMRANADDCNSQIGQAIRNQVASALEADRG
jgi:uncharacterized protein YukE